MTSTSSCVITGAASGIGRALAERLVGAGIHVVGIDWSEEGLLTAKEEFAGKFSPLVGDASEWEVLERARDLAVSSGRLQGWVNNAGVERQRSAHTVSEVEIIDDLRLLQISAMSGTAIAVRAMMTEGGGSIVNVSSIAALVAFPRSFTYQAAKAALIAVSRSVAVDYATFDIRCNTVCPGRIDTPLGRSGNDAEALKELTALRGHLAPIERDGTAREVADVVHFLLSPAASYISGATIPVDGGATARCFAFPVSFGPTPEEAPPSVLPLDGVR